MANEPHAPDDSAKPLELAETLEALHRRYLQTQDVHWVLVAIGMSPQAPPLWATGVCARLAADPGFRALCARHSRRLERTDSAWIDRLARGLSSGTSVGVTSRQLVSEALHCGPPPAPEPDPLRQGRRAGDPLRTGQTLQDAYDIALREIESGDLSTDLDDEVERTRLARSRWLLVHGPSGSEADQLQVRIAPKPRGRNLVRMVKKLLLEQRDRRVRDAGTRERMEPASTMPAAHRPTWPDIPQAGTAMLVRAAATGAEVERSATGPSPPPSRDR